MEQPNDSVAQIFVISDGTGDTAIDAVRAAMLQFRVHWTLRTYAGVRYESEVRRAVYDAEETGALIVFTLVDGRVARVLIETATLRNVPAVDLLGPVIAKVAAHVNAEPRAQPGLLHAFSDDYFRRIEAVEFAVRHDDGANLNTLFGADLVLTGVSRTSKTPLSIYLAQRGYKIGNVPIVPDVEPPRALLDLPPRKVFGLTIESSSMLTLRQARVRSLGTPYSSYADSKAVLDELRRAQRIFRANGWRVVDISGRAVEETAARILQLAGVRRGTR